MELAYSKIDEAINKFGLEVTNEVMAMVNNYGDWIAEQYFKELEQEQHIACLNFIYFNIIN